MTNTKKLKSWKTLASDLREKCKPNLTPEQLEKANKIFEKIDQEQKEQSKEQEKKIAQQPEV